MPDKERPYPDPRVYGEFSEDDPRFQVRLLALRVDQLTKEKEDIEQELREERAERKLLDDRVAKMERTFQRGAGIMIMIPIAGAVVSFLFAYGRQIFAPWLKEN